MIEQKTLVKGSRAELFLDLLELISGLILVGFLWTHMIFVGTIILGEQYFDHLSRFLDDYYLSYIGIPFVIVIALLHIIAAGRRMPLRFKEQRLVWQHAKMLHHFDTWTWVFQAVTGLAIGILASAHVWVVISSAITGSMYPIIQAAVSAERIKSLLWFYLILLVIGEYHACFGFYRQFVKWGWFNRHPIGVVLKVISLIIVIIGLIAIWGFYQVGGVV